VRTKGEEEEMEFTEDPLANLAQQAEHGLKEVLAPFKRSAHVTDAALWCLQYFSKCTALDLEPKPSPDGEKRRLE
jgi:hypothetical protein